MDNIKVVAVDAMGGDNAPVEIVKGCIEAVKEREDIKVLLVGLADVVQAELTKYTYPTDRIEVVPASQVIETAEPPVMAIRKKKDSSIVVALKLVKEGKADGFVSAGSSGAVLVGGQVIVGKIKGVERAPLAPLIPTKKGVSLLIDCGANVDARSSHLVHFARMGSIYMEHVVGIPNPKVAIVNIGAEEEKGNGGFFKKKEKKDKKDAQIEELTDKVRRQMAEFENFRKRSEKEKSQMYEVGAKSILEKILPVVDNFERGLKGMEESEDPFAQGMQMIYKQLMTSLEEAGVSPIEALGNEFDPNFHNAVMHVEDEEAGESEIVEEFQKGYMYHDTVLRHSMVKVAN